MNIPANSRPTRILLIDDHPLLLNLFAEMLRCDGHEVTPIDDPLAALAIFDPATCDLVITDRYLPGMTGDTFAEEIKRVSPTTPVIVMSGHAGASRGSAANLFLLKPFTPGMLVDAIRGCLPGERSSPEPFLSCLDD